MEKLYFGKKIINLKFILKVLFAFVPYCTLANVEFTNFYRNDSIIRVDTLVTADTWKSDEYTKKKTKKGYLETKIIHFKHNHIEIKQSFNERCKSFRNREITVNGIHCNLEYQYKKTYGARLDVNSFIMGNLVTAKYYEEYILIDFVIAQYNCLGEFCNDVEILTLKFSLEGSFIDIYFHDEDFSTYNL